MLAHLLHQKHLLLDKVKGSAPINLHTSDFWRWGKTRVYTPMLGFVALQSTLNQAFNPSIWQHTWDAYGIPGVNFFTWLLIHRKVLTGENIAHKGIIGLHWCNLCRSASESVDHLFISCAFAQSVWALILHGLDAPATLQCTVLELL